MSAFSYEAEGGPETRTAERTTAYLRALRLDNGRWLFYARTILVANPAAGAEWSITVPGGVSWIVCTLMSRLVTDATVANRSPVLALNDGSNDVARLPSAGVQAASLNQRHSWARGFSPAAATANAVEFCSGLPLAPLPANMILKSSTVQLAAGDQYSGVALYVIQVRERTWQELERYADAVERGDHSELFPGYPVGL